ncbi:MAG TPA: L-aspartate oxidase, partial [Vicinamibacterales bacterium]|nr:L-aspartate oxidase [Vicinamibacterales bacterium]
AVRVLVDEGPRYVHELIDWGARFDRDETGRISLGREAAHSVRRVLHAGDATGREIGRALWDRVRTLPSAETIDHALVSELLVEDGQVRGVAYVDIRGVRQEVRADRALLATGGAGRVFRETTNPPVATGDGIALAYRAGARVADLEFVQFHPTALNRAGAPRFLISEALRGEGARLINVNGDAFMPRYHPDGDLAPRDVVSRSIVRESDRTGGPVFLTLAHLNPREVNERFPTIARMCKEFGLDLARDRIPVGPAAHYMMGGVDTDRWGRTSVLGLYAAGEVACTGVHGANRLASNSLLEGLVFGARAAIAMAQPLQTAPFGDDRVSATSPALDGPGRAPDTPRQANRNSPLDSEAVHDLLWRAAGLFRSREALLDADDRLADAEATAERALTQSASQALAEQWRWMNLVTVARLIAHAALRREESRGGHFRADFPERDDLHWRVHIVDQRHAT